MSLHQEFHQYCNILLIDIQIHKKIIHPSEKGTPFKEITTAYNQKGLITLFSEFQCFSSLAVPRNQALRHGPRGCVPC